jgi:L-lactate dehydrogenase complex protein LldF
MRVVDQANEAARFIEDRVHEERLDKILWATRMRRDQAASEVPEWEDLRDLASQIKEHTLSHLADYLEQFEASAAANGAIVHWARDAHEHNEIVYRLLTERGVTSLVKSKSMLTEECETRPFLETRGITVTETDLGERIQQLDDQPPSHITGPAIHKTTEDVATLFAKVYGSDRTKADPVYLAGVMRENTRPAFLEAGAGLLTRSATGQIITQYTSTLRKPRQGGEMHIILVDNGRSMRLGMEKFWRSLKCIRCAACMNTCPVYRRSGGLSYGSTYMGPIGIIMMPMFDVRKFSELPFSSTLNGSCTNVCPVEIDIHEQIYAWREVMEEKHQIPLVKKEAMIVADKVLSNPDLYQIATESTDMALKVLPHLAIYNHLNAWGRHREVPAPADETFHQWYRNNRLLKAHEVLGI